MTAADRPPVMPRVGDTLTTAEQLDALPSLAIVIDANDEVQQRHGHLSTERGDYSAWLGVMPPTCKPSPDVALPVTVLCVPGEQAREGVGTGAGEGDDPAPTEATSWVTRSTDCPEAPAQAHPRPSVADDARAEAERRVHTALSAWEGEEYTEGYVYGFTRGAGWAAGRAETTTATTEDAVGELLERMSDAATQLEALRDGQWYPPERQRLHGKVEGVKLATSYVEEARDLLATARTRPTHAQVMEAVAAHLGWQPGLIEAADAVLALWADQPPEAEAGARALEQAATAWAEDPDAVGDSEKDARNWLRDRADHIRKGGA